MRVELLPSCQPAGDAQFLVSYVIDDAVAIDAGSLGLLADLDRQRRVRHVFITHEHLDHIATLPIFLENVYEPGPDCVEVLAGEAVMDYLDVDVFNDRVWPDFFALSAGDDRFLQGTVIEPGVTVERAGVSFTPVPVSHALSTLGLIVDDGRSVVVVPSDTGPTEAIWRQAAATGRVVATFLECSFPAALADLAARVGHLSTVTFAAEVAKLPRGVRVIVVHRKARYADAIARELAALALPGVELVRPGFTYEF